MGIVNVTPDSFSDGGQFQSVDKAIAHGLQLLTEGADILDIGGESTRPGAAPVSPEEEQVRILPVIEALAQEGAFVSVDTRHSSTMRAAMDKGARMINDVMALGGDGAMNAAASLDVPVCLMHMRGEPGTMQTDPVYDDVVEEVYKFFEERIEACLSAGIKREMILIDPGIGFGKTLAHNLALLKNLKRFKALGIPILLGTSRKSFIEKIDPGCDPDMRLGGSITSVLWGYQQGAKLFRVHDVAETVQALRVFRAIEGS